MAISNTLLTNQIISKTVLKEVHNTLALAHTCTRHYEKDFNNETGNTINIRRPTRYNGTVTTDGDITAYGGESIVQRTVPLTINKQATVKVEITEQQRKLKLDSFSETVARPIGRRLANIIDSDLATTAILNANRYLGTIGSPMNNFRTLALASGALRKFGVVDENYGMLTIDDYTELAASLQNTFNEPLNKKVSKEAMLVSTTAGLQVFQDQNLFQMVNGVYGGTPLVNGANQEGSVLITDGWTPGSILLAGNKFNVANVGDVNPLNRRAVNFSKGYIVTSTATADGSGNMVINVNALDPIFLSPSPYQNVTAAPADNAPITVLGASAATYNQNFFYGNQFLTLAVIPMLKTTTAPESHPESDEQLGLAIRMNGYYGGDNDKSNYRFDILYGTQAFPEYAVTYVT